MPYTSWTEKTSRFSLFHVSNTRVVTASADDRSGGRCMLDNFLKYLWFEFAVVAGI